MADYISREDFCESECGKENREGYQTCVNCFLLNVPSADVKPVKYTENISSFPLDEEFHCKNCGIHLAEWIKLDVEDYEEFEFNFCPKCGAEIIKDGGING